MRVILFVLAMLLTLPSVVAQDLLVKRNGDKLQVRVLSVTKRKVKYVRQGTESPIYTLPVSEIDYIEYPLGDRDTFGEDGSVKQTNSKLGVMLEQQRLASEQTQEPQKWHGAVPYNPATPPAPVERSAEEATLPQYVVGDIYDRNGLRGIVVMTSDDGRHGTIMSLEEECLRWCTLKSKQLKSVGASDRADGRVNMKAVEEYIAANGLSWSDFPAFEWCRQRGEGWYLPSLNEVWMLGTMYNGGSRTAISRKFRRSFNMHLHNAGGIMLSNIMIYYSSTENRNPKMAHYSHMSTEQPHTGTTYKGDELFVRAFHRF